MIRRPPRSTQSRSSAASDVYKRQGYEDVNDQEALARDPAMRAVIGKRALERTAASSGTVSRFETEILTQEQNIDALATLNSGGVSKAVSLSKAKKVILDIDSSESPAHGSQEGSAYNGHFCLLYTSDAADDL